MAFIREEGVCVEWAEGLLLIMQIRDGIHVSSSTLQLVGWVKELLFFKIPLELRCFNVWP